jgi:KUP system potassium uptake protein
MRANVEHNHVLHEHAVILSLETMPIPHVAIEDRIRLDELGYGDDGIVHVTAHYGYMDKPHVPDAVALADAIGLERPVDLDEVSYFLSRIEIEMGDEADLARWRKRLFIATAHLSADAVEYFRLPRDRTLIMGSRIQL